MSGLLRRINHNARWTPEEDAELRLRCDAGEYLNDIARAFGRSQESVRTRANVLRIPCRSAPSRRTSAR